MADVAGDVDPFGPAPTSPTSRTPNMATLLAQVPPEPTPEPKTDHETAARTAAAAAEAKSSTVGRNGKPSTVTASRARPDGTSPADGTTNDTTKGVPVKRLLVWAVPLVFLAVGAALMHQSQTAGVIFLLAAFVAVIVMLIAKWRGKRRATRAAADRDLHPKSPGRGRGADRGGGPGPGGGKGGIRGALSAVWPFGKRARGDSTGRGPGGGGPGGPGARSPAGGKVPAGGLGAPSGKGGGLFAKLNPFSRTKPGAPGGKPAPAGTKTPANGTAATPASGAPTAPKGLSAKLRNLLGRKPAATPSGPGGRAPAGGRTPTPARAPAPGRPDGATPRGPRGRSPGGSGGTRGGWLRGLFARNSSGPAGSAGPSPDGGSAPSGSGSVRRRWWRRSRNQAAENPRNWRNSSQRYEQWAGLFRRGSDVPRYSAPGRRWRGAGDSERTAVRDPADPADRSGRWTRHGSEYRGGGQREQFATSAGGGARRNPDGSYDGEPVDDTHAPRTPVWMDGERMDRPSADTCGSRPLAPAPAGIGPATSSYTNTSGGNTMTHHDQQTGARSADVLEGGAAGARVNAARKADIAAEHRRQAVAVSGMPEMTDTAAGLRAEAARADDDAAARRGISAAFSLAAAEHRGG